MQQIQTSVDQIATILRRRFEATGAVDAFDIMDKLAREAVQIAYQQGALNPDVNTEGEAYMVTLAGMVRMSQADGAAEVAVTLMQVWREVFAA